MQIAIKYSFLISLFTVAFLFGNDDRAQIINALEQWPKDFNARRTNEVCSLFAKDLVASYPGTSDANYEEMCAKLTKVLQQKDRIFRYEAPEIEQVILKDDFAVVRLIWTLKVYDSQENVIDVIHEKGMDLFKKQQDGSWKIAISFAYTLEDQR